MWHLYLIRTNQGHLYTGVTQDVQRRFKEHQEGGLKAATGRVQRVRHYPWSILWEYIYSHNVLEAKTSNIP